MPRPLDDETQVAGHPNPLRTLARLIVFAMLLTAVLYLLLLHIEPGAPFRQGGHPPPGEAWVEARMTEHDAAVTRAADGKNLELHFSGPVDPRVTEMYYHWNYLQYPNRVFVGREDRVVNNSEQLFAADRLPDDDWLRAHRVGSVFAVTPLPDGGFETITRPVQ